MPLLLGEIDGHPCAALSLSDGSVIADPFYPTADLVCLLRTHARTIAASPRRPLRRRRLGLAHAC